MKPLRQRGSISTFALTGFILLVPFENNATGLRSILLGLAAAATVWELTAPTGACGARSAKWWRKLWGAGAALGAAVIAAAVARAMHLGGASAAREAIGDVARHVAPFALLAPFAVALTRERIESRLERTIWIGAAAWLAVSVVSACAGADPVESFDLFYEEMGAYAAVYWAFVMKAKTGGARGRLTALVVAGAIVGAIAGGTWLAGHAGADDRREALLDRKILRVGDNEQGQSVLRAQFPFAEHNRLGSFLTIAALLAPVAMAAGALTRRSLAAILAALALMLLGILASGTRGAMIAVAAGLAVASVGRPRVFALAIVAAIAVVALVPDETRRHAASIFNPETYRKSRGNIQYRLRTWETATRMMRDRPLLGVGFGWKLFEAHYPQYVASEGEYEKDVPHAHNNFLEIAVESGSIGLAAFLVFQAALVGGILSRRVRTDGEGLDGALRWALLGLMVGIHLYGMSNYSLRRSVGFEVWLAWGVVHAASIGGWRRRVAPTESDGAPNADATQGADSKSGVCTNCASIGTQ